MKNINISTKIFAILLSLLLVIESVTWADIAQFNNTRDSLQVESIFSPLLEKGIALDSIRESAIIYAAKLCLENKDLRRIKRDLAKWSVHLTDKKQQDISDNLVILDVEKKGDNTSCVTFQLDNDPDLVFTIKYQDRDSQQDKISAVFGARKDAEPDQLKQTKITALIPETYLAKPLIMLAKTHPVQFTCIMKKVAGYYFTEDMYSSTSITFVEGMIIYLIEDKLREKLSEVPEQVRNDILYLQLVHESTELLARTSSSSKEVDIAVEAIALIEEIRTYLSLPVDRRGALLLAAKKMDQKESDIADRFSPQIEFMESLDGENITSVKNLEKIEAFLRSYPLYAEVSEDSFTENILAKLQLFQKEQKIDPQIIAEKDKLLTRLKPQEEEKTKIVPKKKPGKKKTTSEAGLTSTETPTVSEENTSDKKSGFTIKEMKSIFGQGEEKAPKGLKSINSKLNEKKRHLLRKQLQEILKKNAYFRKPAQHTIRALIDKIWSTKKRGLFTKKELSYDGIDVFEDFFAVIDVEYLEDNKWQIILNGYRTYETDWGSSTRQETLENNLILLLDGKICTVTELLNSKEEQFKKILKENGYPEPDKTKMFKDFVSKLLKGEYAEYHSSSGNAHGYWGADINGNSQKNGELLEITINGTQEEGDYDGTYPQDPYPELTLYYDGENFSTTPPKGTYDIISLQYQLTALLKDQNFNCLTLGKARSFIRALLDKNSAQVSGSWDSSGSMAGGEYNINGTASDYNDGILKIKLTGLHKWVDKFGSYDDKLAVTVYFDGEVFSPTPPDSKRPSKKTKPALPKTTPPKEQLKKILETKSFTTHDILINKILELADEWTEGEHSLAWEQPGTGADQYFSMHFEIKDTGEEMREITIYGKVTWDDGHNQGMGETTYPEFTLYVDGENFSIVPPESKESSKKPVSTKDSILPKDQLRKILGTNNFSTDNRLISQILYCALQWTEKKDSVSWTDYGKGTKAYFYFYFEAKKTKEKVLEIKISGTVSYQGLDDSLPYPELTIYFDGKVFSLTPPDSRKSANAVFGARKWVNKEPWEPIITGNIPPAYLSAVFDRVKETHPAQYKALKENVKKYHFAGEMYSSTGVTRVGEEIVYLIEEDLRAKLEGQPQQVQDDILYLQLVHEGTELLARGERTDTITPDINSEAVALIEETRAFLKLSAARRKGLLTASRQMDASEPDIDDRFAPVIGFMNYLKVENLHSNISDIYLKIIETFLQSYPAYGNVQLDLVSVRRYLTGKKDKRSDPSTETATGTEEMELRKKRFAVNFYDSLPSDTLDSTEGGTISSEANYNAATEMIGDTAETAIYIFFDQHFINEGTLALDKDQKKALIRNVAVTLKYNLTNFKFDTDLSVTKLIKVLEQDTVFMCLMRFVETLYFHRIRPVYKSIDPSTANLPPRTGYVKSLDPAGEILSEDEIDSIIKLLSTPRAETYGKPDLEKKINTALNRLANALNPGLTKRLTDLYLSTQEEREILFYKWYHLVNEGSTDRAGIKRKDKGRKHANALTENLQNILLTKKDKEALHAVTETLGRDLSNNDNDSLLKDLRSNLHPAITKLFIRMISHSSPFTYSIAVEEVGKRKAVIALPALKRKLAKIKEINRGFDIPTDIPIDDYSEIKALGVSSGILKEEILLIQNTIYELEMISKRIVNDGTESEDWLNILGTANKEIYTLCEPEIYNSQPVMINIGLSPGLSAKTFTAMKSAGMEIKCVAERKIASARIGNISIRLFEDTPEMRKELVDLIKGDKRIPEEKRQQRVLTYIYQDNEEVRDASLEETSYVIYLGGEEGRTTTPIDACILTGLEYFNYKNLLDTELAKENPDIPWINASAERFAKGIAAISGVSNVDSILDLIAPISDKGIRNILRSGLIFVKIKPVNIEDIRIFYEATAKILRSL